jgi:hypothetical protein
VHLPVLFRHVFIPADRTIGKVCYRISGSIPAKNFLQVPKKKTDSLSLTGRYLYAMICVHPSKLFVMHFDLVVEEGFTVRLSISNIFKADEQVRVWGTTH